MRKRHDIIGGNQIFDAMVARVLEKSKKAKVPEYKAFPLWFIPIYYANPAGIAVTDGCKDGRVDAHFSIVEGGQQIRVLLNSKFTKTYNKMAPPAFYHEISRYAEAFEKPDTREEFLKKAIRTQLQDPFVRFFDEYDNGRLRLLFLTNYRRNESQMWSVGNLDCFHFEDIAAWVINDREKLIPRTKDLVLRNISPPLSASEDESAVPIAVTFARLIDFISYMKDDPLDLFFQRNVRLDLGQTVPNRDIASTFRNAPDEFIYSNNGITLLVEDLPYDSASRTLRVTNPRVVNGSQTLHHVFTVKDPSVTARVMVRILKIPFIGSTLDAILKKRKEIVEAIAFRSNLQNPIEPWDLCANDDNQIEIHIYFLKKGLYYETRRNEWQKRKSQLSGVEVATNVKTMGQLLASSNWSAKSPLGPAVAKNKVKLLFDRSKGGGYKHIRRLGTDEAYNLYCLYNALDKLVLPQRIKPMKRHANFALFALFCKAIERANFSLRDKHIAAALESLGASYAFRRAAIRLARDVHAIYVAENKSYKALNQKELPYNGFFKQESYVEKVVRSPVSGEIVALVRKCLTWTPPA